ncbi:MAG: RNA-binding protein [Eubacteriales bacterium]|jgi:RNA-binding protein YlmH
MELEEKLLAGRIGDLCQKSRRLSMQVCSHFLDSAQQRLALQTVKQFPDLHCMLYGGLEESERQICCVYPEFLEFVPEEVPLTLLRIDLKTPDRLSHRDYLGAILGLGIKRERVGDLLCGEGVAYAAVAMEIAPYIQEQLREVGRCSVREIREVTPEQVELKRQFQTLRDTIPSPRLDAVLSSLVRTSRGKAQQLTAARLVQVNHQLETRNDRNIVAGDILSIRGTGRFIIDDVSGETRKGRIILLARKYI